MAAGMAALRERGIVHRDLKPNNILVEQQEEEEREEGEITYKIADLGLTKLFFDNEEGVAYSDYPTFVAPEVIEMFLKKRNKNSSLTVGTHYIFRFMC